MSYRPPQRIDQITPGYFSTRLVRGGPPVAAEIRVEGGIITALVNGEPTGTLAEADLEQTIIDAVSEGEAFRHPVLQIAWFGKPIDAAEYRHLLREARWAAANRPSHPLANPDKRVDMGKLPIADIF